MKSTEMILITEENEEKVISLKQSFTERDTFLESNE